MNENGDDKEYSDDVDMEGEESEGAVEAANEMTHSATSFSEVAKKQRKRKESECEMEDVEAELA